MRWKDEQQRRHKRDLKKAYEVVELARRHGLTAEHAANLYKQAGEDIGRAEELAVALKDQDSTTASWEYASRE